jgi:plasmid maintenance system antidote protein VapI
LVNSGKTQYRIAKDSGVPQPVVNRFINGERSIGLETASKLCVYLRLRLARIR